jgi:predicted small metal-binding protein
MISWQTAGEVLQFIERPATVTPVLPGGDPGSRKGHNDVRRSDLTPWHKTSRKSLERKEEAAIAKILRCRDLGVNCPKELRADTEEELMRLAAEHAEKDHGISASNLPPSILAMVKAAIKDG